MKCWRCNNELSSGLNTCTFCGANQIRTNPESPEGKALRQLYDRYGADKLLGDSALLVNGFGDLCPDENKRKSQLKLIADSGALKMFQAQINVEGKSTESFNKNVGQFISDSTGLSVTVAKEFVSIFNEMIGWIPVDAEEQSTIQHKETEEINREDKNIPESECIEESTTKHHGLIKSTNNLRLHELASIIALLLSFGILAAQDYNHYTNYPVVMIILLVPIVCVLYNIIKNKNKDRNKTGSRKIAWINILFSTLIFIVVIASLTGARIPFIEPYIDDDYAQRYVFTFAFEYFFYSIASLFLCSKR